MQYMCVLLLVVCTTSLIRKIDRALFTFWLYIICRRRCVILIFIFFFVFIVVFWFTFDMYFSLGSHLSLLHSDRSVIPVCLLALCDQNALFSFCACLFHSGNMDILFFSFLFDYYIIIVDTDMCECCMPKRSARKHTIQNRLKVRGRAHEKSKRFIIIFGGFLSYSLHTYYFSVTPLFVLFIFFFFSSWFLLFCLISFIPSLFSYFLIFKIK